ncbi:hypothetical protein FC36_GL001409 [Ligilactobacillus equi DSM 15833 = JCM 10991]|uniref:Uncharacterized protein n=1 Tax=Ligilactobacillus equi DSM 15833 = JCM 10991 TaxID=1423740 RepID=A0A0R1TKP7_9LACO|nr:hypothetical protein FC36_GL001409 [Ligilactobacillus equi DSM 15833 = JCM 10991]
MAQLARVTYLNENKTQANVQPMALNYKDDSKRSLLINVPVGKTCQNFIGINSVVLVTFLDRSISNWDGTNKDFKLDSKRMHDLNDAVITEVLP